MAKKISLHFTDDEMRCRCGCGGLSVNDVLLQQLDKLREDWGEPVIVNRAYSCEKHNAEVGGLPNSQHVLGKAADITINNPTPERLAAFYGFILGTKYFTGVGYYPGDSGTFVHVDVRPGHSNENNWRGNSGWFYKH